MKPYGPYSAQINKDGEHIISYNGNAQSEAISDIRALIFDEAVLKNRLDELVYNRAYRHIQAIDSGIFFAAVEFFQAESAEWCNLPLTTRMISSPGEIYAGGTLDYTTDALPVELNWFDSKRPIFLSESSQFYLELRLLLDGLDKVFCIYNSFRKEKADATHLSEFQHIEFEGKVGFEENILLATRLIRYITNYLIHHNRKNLEFFLSENEIEALDNMFDDSCIKRITFHEAVHLLYQDTNEIKYQEASLKHFGSWEEIRLTEILGGHVLITNFPLLEIPFYHNMKRNNPGSPLAENADLILFGYREAVGSGTRISDKNALVEKAHRFNLPVEDYQPYLKTREYSHYKQTSGFGLGWQRYVQWLLKLPVIWESTLIPRGHTSPQL